MIICVTNSSRDRVRIFCCIFYFLVFSLILTTADARPAQAGWKVDGGGLFCGGAVIAIDSADTTYFACPHLSGSRTFIRVTAFNKRGIRGPTYEILLQNSANVLPEGMQISIALDSRNHPHFALNLMTEHAYEVGYLSLEAGKWTLQTIDTKYSQSFKPPQIAMDANDNPHIAYDATDGLLRHAYFDGNEWRIENLELPIEPTGIKIASAGMVHIVGLTNTTNEIAQICEERGLNGTWTGECLDNAIGSPSLTLTQNGAPEVLYQEASTTCPIISASFNGSEWTTQATFEAGNFISFCFDPVALALAADGSAQLFFQDIDFNLQYAAQDGSAWSVTDLGKLPELYDLTLVLDPIGLPHSAFVVDGVQIYLALLLPDLSVNWQSISAKPVSGETEVTSKLFISNIGTSGTVKGSTISYYLSLDNKIDSTSTLLKTTPLNLGSGMKKMFTFGFSSHASIGGEYLIASFNPANSPIEMNSNATTAAIEIP